MAFFFGEPDPPSNGLSLNLPNASLIDEIDKELCRSISLWLWRPQSPANLVSSSFQSQISLEKYLLESLGSINEHLKLREQTISSLRFISSMVIKRDEDILFDVDIDAFIQHVNEGFQKDIPKYNWLLPSSSCGLTQKEPRCEEEREAILKKTIGQLVRNLGKESELVPAAALKLLYEHLPIKKIYQTKHKFLRLSGIYDNWTQSPPSVKVYIDSISKIIFSLNLFSKEALILGKPALHFLHIPEGSSSSRDITDWRLTFDRFGKCLPLMTLERKTKYQENQKNPINKKVTQGTKVKAYFEKKLKEKDQDFQFLLYNWVKGKHWDTQERRIKVDDLKPLASSTSPESDFQIARLRELLVDSKWIKAMKKKREDVNIIFTFIFGLRHIKKLLPLSDKNEGRVFWLSRDIRVFFPLYDEENASPFYGSFIESLNQYVSKCSENEPTKIPIPAFQALRKNLEKTCHDVSITYGSNVYGIDLKKPTLQLATLLPVDIVK